MRVSVPQCEKLEDQIRLLSVDPRGRDDRSTPGAGSRGGGYAGSRGDGASVSQSLSRTGSRTGAPGPGRDSPSSRPASASYRRARSASPLNSHPGVQKALTKPTMGIGDRFRTAKVPDPGAAPPLRPARPATPYFVAYFHS